MKRSKKGVSLAFVIVVVMALIIFSAMLFSAASHSMSMTGESTDGRQAYLTAKSAVEYAKSVAYDQAKAGALKPFAVSQNTDGTFQDVPNIDPNLSIYKNLDGTTNYATCTNPGGDGISWKITAKVKYRNSAQYRQLAYDFKLQYGESTLGAVNSYAAAGWRYGNNTILDGNNSFSGSPNIPYPFVSAKAVPITSQDAAAPEMYFLNEANSFSASGNGGTFSCSLDSNIIFFNGPITGGSTDAKNVQSLTLKNTQYNRLQLEKGYSGIVWFHNVTISDYGITSKMADGPYYFDNDVNLFDYGSLQSGEPALTRVQADDFEKIPSLKAMNLPAKVSYYETNADKIKSSETNGVGWTSAGKLSTNPSDQRGNDVFLYTMKDVNNTYRADLQNFHSTVIYKARSIAMQYVRAQGVPFEISDQTIIFQTGTFWFNAQSTDGYPADDPNANDMTAIEATSPVSHFIVRSPDNSPVKLILPHGLVVKNLAGDIVYKFDPRVQASYRPNDSSTFTFTVPSKTDLLSLSKLTPVPAGSGGSGGSGTFTITPGNYTGS